MAPTALSEIRGFAGIIDELDYYELLDVPREAPAVRVKDAYYAAARRFHPDAHGHLEPELRYMVERVAKRISEAYSVLRDPRRRRLYDERIKQSPERRRLQLVEARAETTRRSNDQAHGQTAGGRRYFALARAEIERRNFAAAGRHLQMAMTFEPDNAVFKRTLEDLQRKQR